jgi:transcriptional regulator with XRE-family HTH domain
MLLELPTIVARIKFEREIQKIFSNEMAVHLEISDKTYQRIEKMETDLSLRHFLKICDKLNRRPGYFIGDTDNADFDECKYCFVLKKLDGYSNHNLK